ncbi:hypothetical protein ACQ4M3_13240 [Leptolyngbya sp. AN03gr2]|uniref:hypothetical protein n=1 Tax=unclassified Leptolyngbya TaxID=2650499 RepID=UPI003D3142A9
MKTATFHASEDKIDYFKELSTDVLDVESIIIEGNTITLVGTYLDREFCEITAKHAGVEIIEFKDSTKD